MKMVIIMVSAAANDDVADDDDADDDAAGDNVDDAAADGNDAAAAVDAAAAAAVDDADTWDKILIALYIGGTPQVLAQVQTRFDPLDTLIWVMTISMMMMIVMLMRIKWMLVHVKITQIMESKSDRNKLLTHRERTFSFLEFENI